MLKKSKETLKLKVNWKKKWKKDIVDIFLFGSAIKGKQSPNDIDICLVFREKINLEIIKEIGNILGDQFHISSLVVDNFFTNPHSLTHTMLLEGISLISGNKFADVFSLRGKILYNYDLTDEKPSKKVRFVYLLRGRDHLKGLIENWGGEFISNNAFMIDMTKDNEAQELFNKWRIKHKRTKLLLMR